MILSAGMRTDIPAFYSKWFMNRVRDGYVYVRNPYYRNKVTKYLITPNNNNTLWKRYRTKCER